MSAPETPPLGLAGPEELHSHPPPAMPPLTFGRFAVRREVGRGRISVVYRAVDPLDKALVALKVLYPGPELAPLNRVAEAVEREAGLLEKLKHPQIVGIRESGVAEGHAYLVFPFVEGVSFDQAVTSGLLDRRAALEVLAKVARAVHYAHEQGLIHRDLKPGNILVTKEREPFVLDFGLSWRRGEKAEQGVQTIAGTPAYMSPEQARGVEQQLTPATDVYGLGAILYEALSGRAPFTGETSWKIMQAGMVARPVPPSQVAEHVDPHAEKIALCCLEKDPHKRYRSAELLAEDLLRAARGETPRGPGHTSILGRFFT